MMHIFIYICIYMRLILFSLQDNFKTGNVVQLVSQSSGHCLQIVMGPMGQLVVDGMGPEGPTVYHGKQTYFIPQTLHCLLPFNFLVL
jgi:hypothetical protein